MGEAVFDLGSGIRVGDAYVYPLPPFPWSREATEEDEEELGEGVVRDSEGVRVATGRVWADGRRRATLRNLSNGEGCSSSFQYFQLFVKISYYE